VNTPSEPLRTLHDILLNPRSVALIGASDDVAKVTGRPLAFLKANHSTATLIPVNPNRKTVQGIPALPSILEASDTVEHAYVLLDADNAVTAVAQCAEAGVQVVTVLADGFSEAGRAGQIRQAQLLDIARHSGMRVIGPNSMGVVNLHSGFVCTTNAAFAAQDLTPGRYGVLSQSGSIIGTLLSRGHAVGVHFSFFLSLGNEADLTLGEVGKALVDHDQTDAFILFMECLRKPAEIAAFANAARARDKPVIVYKLGRSQLADSLAVSHTGAIVGSDAAAAYFFRQHGITRVDHFDTLFELPRLLCRARGVSESRPATATIVTTTGGGGAMVVDRLGVLGVEIAAPGHLARAALAEHGIHISNSPLVDVTLAGANYTTMKAVITALIKDPETGLVVVAIGSSAQFFPQLAVHPIIDAVKAVGEHGAPVLGFPLPDAPQALQLLASQGIATARTVESCAEMAAQYLAGNPPLGHDLNTPPLLQLNLENHNDGVLNEIDSGRIVQRLGIVLPRHLFLHSDEPLPESINLKFPLVAKLVSSALPHKSQSGAVSLGIADVKELRAVTQAMRRRVIEQTPQAVIEGVLIQEQITGLAEVMIGISRDPAVGATITLAAGGVLAEIYQDYTLRIAPVDATAARQMIDEVKGLALIRGYRNLPWGDLGALAESITRFSQLAADDRIHEAEINPLIVGRAGQGCVAVDALIRLQSPATRQASDD